MLGARWGQEDYGGRSNECRVTQGLNEHQGRAVSAAGILSSPGRGGTGEVQVHGVQVCACWAKQKSHTQLNMGSRQEIDGQQIR